MSLIPSSALTLGNLKYDTHLSNLVATMALLPAVNSVVAHLPTSVEISAAPGDPALLELDGGDGASTVLTGSVRGFHRSIRETRAVAADAGADLSAYRPAVTFEKQDAGDVIRALASEAGVSISVVEMELPLAAYVAHQRRTAAEHIAYLASLAGAIASVTADGELSVVARPGEQPEMALLYGREIIEYDVRERPGPPVQRVVVGSGPAGAANAPDALRPSAGHLPGNAPDPGVGTVWQSASVLRTPGAAVTASQAATTDAAASASAVQMRCFLLPSLRPGMVIEVQELPEGLSGGPWLITRVTHQLAPGLGGVTTLEGQSAGADGGLGGLLGAALAAVGSVL